MEKSLLNLNFHCGVLPRFKYSILFFLFFVTSCSQLNFWKKNTDNQIDFSEYSSLNRSDYEAQMNYYEEFLKTNNSIQIVKVTESSKNYLASIASELTSKNEIFYKRIKVFSFEIIKDARPIYFSLPSGKIFLSSGLLDKYVKHESVLASIIAFESIRAEKSIYPKKIMIPVGTLPLEKLLSQSRITSEEKIEIHKWAYHIIRRCGFDSSYYLSWLQIQNRNSFDFAPMLGDPSVISKEEAYFKAFLFKHNNDEEIIFRKDSSKEFYKFLDEIKFKTERA